MQKEMISVNPFSLYLNTKTPRKCDFCAKHLIPYSDQVFVIMRRNIESKKKLANKYLCMECGSKPETVLFYNSNGTVMPYDIPDQKINNDVEIPSPKFVEETIKKVTELPTEVPTKKTFFKRILNAFGL